MSCRSRFCQCLDNLATKPCQSTTSSSPHLSVAIVVFAIVLTTKRKRPFAVVPLSLGVGCVQGQHPSAGAERVGSGAGEPPRAFQAVQSLTGEGMRIKSHSAARWRCLLAEDQTEYTSRIKPSQDHVTVREGQANVPRWVVGGSFIYTVRTTQKIPR